MLVCQEKDPRFREKVVVLPLVDNNSQSLVVMGYRVASSWHDNVDTAFKALVNCFQLGESEKGRRSRCCGHIINLAAKAFILGADYEIFIDEIEVVELITARDE